MTDNERISEWYGRSSTERYSSNQALWTQHLFQKIEDEGLADEMQYWFYAILNDEPEIYCKGHSIMLGSVTMWEIFKATPAQKATALARAIQEVG